MFPDGQQVNNCFPPENKMAAFNLPVYNWVFFKFFKDYRIRKRQKNPQQAIENAVEILQTEFSIQYCLLCIVFIAQYNLL
jgi:hypothetical protein